MSICDVCGEPIPDHHTRMVAPNGKQWHAHCAPPPDVIAKETDGDA